MTAYLFIKTKIHNPDEYMRYVKAVREVAAKHKSRYIVRSRAIEVLEGDAAEWGDYLLLVSEFPDADAAREFWHSPEYREVKSYVRGTAPFTSCSLNRCRKTELRMRLSATIR